MFDNYCYTTSMKDYQGLYAALAQGLILSVYINGGSLRVATLCSHRDQLGYGEHLSVRQALTTCSSAFLAGPAHYESLYTVGPLPSAQDLLDAWVFQGYALVCIQEKAGIICRTGRSRAVSLDLLTAMESAIAKEYARGLQLIDDQRSSGTTQDI